ncbi:MOSC domain-containing protein [Symbiobacterium terraclitae]|uniref:MOSC domain-containing protein n=1 Tax=Symbiobacterium terraclitae TaxID=557451 RepID=UPI0035B55B56
MRASPAHGTARIVGQVTQLRRYPVKSMLGEEVRAAEVTSRGILGDRAYALVDRETGRVASAKRPHLWRRLLACAAEMLPAGAAADGRPAVRIALPDGRAFRNTEPGLEEALSELLGRRVSLVAEPPAEAQLERADPEEVLLKGTAADVPFSVGPLGAGSPAGTFFDFAPVHLITTATLSRLAAWSRRGKAEAVRFRPNIVVDTAPARDAFLENEWVGSVLQVGADVLLRVVVPTPRCAVPTLAHGDLPDDPEPLRVASQHNRVPIPGLGPLPCVGIYAQVVRPGRVSEGDPVCLLPG